MVRAIASSILECCLIVPVKNEAGTVTALLDSIAAQTCSPSQVILVDSGSADDTVAIARAHTFSSLNLTVIEAGPLYPGQARNLGVSKTTAPVIAFTDAGIVLDDIWLERLLEPLQNDAAVDVVYGSFEPIAPSFFSQSAAIAYISPPVMFHGAKIRGPVVPSCAMRREVFDEVGGFPPFRAAEDLIFMEKIEAAGYEIRPAADAVCRWELPDGWRSLFRRFASYSFHNLKAGRGRYWHHAIARYYVIGLAFIGAGLFQPLLLAAPPLLFCARVLKTLMVKRNTFDFAYTITPARFISVAAILLVIDFATVTGFLRFIAAGSEGVTV